MIHLSKFLIGIRHNRVFRARSLTGQLIDDILIECPSKFTKVAESQDREEVILTDKKKSLSFRNNKDDIIIESNKIFDWDIEKYIEIDKKELLEYSEKCLTIVANTLSLKNDFKRIGIIFELRIPKWDIIKASNFATLIQTNFVNYPLPKDTLEIAESNLRFAYKLKAPGGGVIKKIDDYRNIIVRIEESKGINEKGEEEKCLLLSADIQHYFDPLKNSKEIIIKEHFSFAEEHLKTSILPIFKDKGIDITYE